MIRCNNCFGQYSEEFEICPHCGFYHGMEENPLYRLPHGTLLYNRYVVGELMGQGGFGIVYKAWDTKLDTVVAIKEYYPVSLVNRVPGTREVLLVAKKNRKIYENTYKHFLAEARNLAKFSGENGNIVDVFNYFEENGTAYFVMEFMQGLPLHKYIRNKGIKFMGMVKAKDSDELVEKELSKLPVERCVEIISHMCDVLDFVHKKGIVHRDVAPDNIYMCDDNTVKLYDFGVAKFVDDDSEVEIALKPGFSPAEQYDNVSKQGTWTDVYALGATMYRMITGRMPEESTNRKIADKTPAPHELEPDIPVNISNAIMKAMAVETHMRFKNMEEFKKALNGQKKVLNPNIEKKRRKRRRIISIVAAVVVLLACGGTFALKWYQQKEAETLPKATIEMWYAEDEYGEKKKAAYEAIIKEFTTSYPDVTVNLTGIPEADYETTLKDALVNGNGPHLFENNEIDGLTVSDTKDVQKVIKNEKGNLAHDDELVEYVSKTGKVPLGFSIPVVYVNKGKEEVSSLNDAITKLGITDINIPTEKDAFLQKEVNYYVGMNTDYKSVQLKLAGLYKMFLADTKWKCQYDMEFSIGDCDKNQEKCAIRFLQFCYSDNAQDSLFIQNDTGSLPFNEEALGVYEKYNQEYKGFFDNLDKYTFE